VVPADELLTPDEAPRALGSRAAGLTTREASERLAELGPNQIEAHGPRMRRAPGAQARNPFTLLLVGAAAIGAIAQD
jgi:Mg2+-importing ATPase